MRRLKAFPKKLSFAVRQAAFDMIEEAASIHIRVTREKFYSGSDPVTGISRTPWTGEGGRSFGYRQVGTGKSSGGGSSAGGYQVKFEVHSSPGTPQTSIWEDPIPPGERIVITDTFRKWVADKFARDKPISEAGLNAIASNIVEKRYLSGFPEGRNHFKEGRKAAQMHLRVSKNSFVRDAKYYYRTSRMKPTTTTRLGNRAAPDYRVPGQAPVNYQSTASESKGSSTSSYAA